MKLKKKKVFFLAKGQQKRYWLNYVILLGSAHRKSTHFSWKRQQAFWFITIHRWFFFWIMRSNARSRIVSQFIKAGGGALRRLEGKKGEKKLIINLKKLSLKNWRDWDRVNPHPLWMVLWNTYIYNSPRPGKKKKKKTTFIRVSIFLFFKLFFV